MLLYLYIHRYNQISVTHAELKVSAQLNMVIQLDKLGLGGSQEPCCMYFPSVTVLPYIGLQVTAMYNRFNVRVVIIMKEPTA